MSMFSELWDDFVAWLAEISGSVLKFLMPIGREIAKSGGKLLIEIAVASVTTLATTDLTNEEKRDAAFKEITENAKAKGIEAGENAIRASIEIAVAQLKAMNV
jgi:hypothetical protein